MPIPHAALLYGYGSYGSGEGLRVINAGTAERQLRYRLEPGTVQQADLEIELNMSTFGMPVVFPTVRMSMTNRVERITEEGNIRYSVELDGIEVLSRQGVDPNMVTILRDGLESLKGTNDWVEVTDQGEVVRGAELPESNNQLVQSMRNLMAQSMHFLQPLPGEAVGPGAKWEVSGEAEGNGLSFTQKSQYSLRELGANHASLDVSVSIDAPEGSMQIEQDGMTLSISDVTGSGTGHVLIQFDRVIPEMDLQASMGMKVNNIPTSQTTSQRVRPKAIETPCTDEFEPNNSKDAATHLGVDSYRGLKICEADRDWFLVDLPAGKTLEVELLFAHSAGDIDATLHTPSNQQIRGTSSTDNERMATAEAEPGRYYIEVFGYGSCQNTYDLVISSSGSDIPDPDPDPDTEGDRFEPNNGSSSATFLAEGSYSDLHIGQNDQDWFAVALKEGESFSVEVIFENAQGDLDVQLLNTSGRLDAGDSSSDNESVSISNAPAGTYFIQVYGYSTSQNSYRLDVEID